MGLFSFFRKNKQDSTSVEGEFSSRAEEESNAIRGRGKRKQGTAPVDPVLPEKKRARRRLVGAVALVLAVIIGLPMILDSEPKPLADDIAIQIPSKDKPVAPAADHPASASSSSRVAASAALDKKEEIVDAANLPGTPAASTKPGAEVAAADAKAVEPTKPASTDKPPQNPHAAVKPDSKSETKPVEKAAAKPDPKVAAQAAAKADDAARAKAILEGQPEAPAKPAADKKSGKFVVQVAALATQEKINELQGKLKEAGIKSYTQKVATESGDRTRIRVGPFASKEEAEKVRGKLAQIGLNGTLVPLAN